MTNATAGWAGTHRAPGEGMDVWAHPDPTTDPSSEVEGGVELQVTETSGEWAMVVAENGWSGWVDGRMLEQIGEGNEDMQAYVLLGIALLILVVLAVMGWT